MAPLDELWIYDRVLSSEEIKKLYERKYSPLGDLRLPDFMKSEAVKILEKHGHDKA